MDTNTSAQWEFSDTPQDSTWELEPRIASKLDHLRNSAGFAQTPAGRAGIHMLKTRYPSTGDPLFPLLFREFKKGHEARERGEEAPPGFVISPTYLEHHHNYERALENDDPRSNDYRMILDGDRPDGYFWRANGERFEPVQPGMVQNLGKMLRWMKAHNHAAPNVQQEGTSLEQLQAMYKKWNAVHNQERDQNLGTVSLEYPDGWTIRELTKPEECYDEGEEMEHCGAKYAPLVGQHTHQVFSLRDPKNVAHATVVYRPQEHTIEDVRGRRNQAPNQLYTGYLNQFWPALGEGLTVSGHNDPEAPAIPNVNAFGLPVVGREAIRQGFVEPHTAMTKHAWTVIADKLNDFLLGGKLKRDHQGLPYFDEEGNPIYEKYHRPEFADPNHPHFERNREFLDALAHRFHTNQTDELFPWLANEYLHGRLRYRPDVGAASRFQRAVDPEHHLEQIEEMRQRYLDAGYTPEQADQRIMHDGPRAWEPLRKADIDSVGDWLFNTNSQNPTRAGFDILNASWNDMQRRVEDYKDWKRRKESVKRAIFKSKDGKMHVVTLEPKDAAWEGNTMQNCIAQYGNALEARTSQIYSLRDKNGNPKVDIEVKPGAFYNPKTKETLTPNEFHRAREGRQVTCPTCNGNGQNPDPNQVPETCPNCGQHGTVQPMAGYETDYWQCTNCHLEIYRRHCPQCQGTGEVRQPVREDLDDFVASPFNGQVVQVQGKQNRPPDERYHPYVKEFFSRIPEEKKPQWYLPHTHFDRMQQLFDPVHEHIVYYHPGDYGLPHPNVTTDWPKLMHSYVNSGETPYDGASDEDIARAENNNRMRARYVYHWGKYGNEMEQMAQAMDDPRFIQKLKADLARNQDLTRHPEYRQWSQQNPGPGEFNMEAPTGFNEAGEDIYGTPEYQTQADAYRQAYEQHWIQQQAYQDKRQQVLDELQARAGEEQWANSSQYKMLDLLRRYMNGETPHIQEFEDMEHHGSVTHASSWCYCGHCEDAWGWFRYANEQAYNRVRNMLRKNNQLTPVNSALLAGLRHHYPDHGQLGDFLHREARKGRLKSNPTAERLLRNIKYNRERAKEYPVEAQYYEDRANEEEAQLERSMQRDVFRYEHPETGEDVPLTKEHMTDLAEYLRRRGQREKGFNIMKQELPTIASEAAKEAEQKRMEQHGGQIIHRFGAPYDGWTLRYIDNPHLARNESDQMGHCIKHYDDYIVGGVSHNYTLRDPENKSHLTMELHPEDRDQLDWDKLRAANDPAVVDRMKGIFDRWRERAGTNPYTGHMMNPDSSTYYGDGQNEGEEGRELYNWLMQQRQRGLVDPPNIRNAKVYQFDKGYNISHDDLQNMMQQWMSTVPYADRPVGRGGYYDADKIDSVDRLPRPGEGPTNKYGFKAEDGGVDWPQVVNTMHRNGVYDPARGLQALEYAQNNGQAGDLYGALKNWENQPKPPCPKCGSRYDVRDNRRNPDKWRCDYCSTSFDKQPQQLDEYKQQALWHLGPKLAESPDAGRFAHITPKSERRGRPHFNHRNQTCVCLWHIPERADQLHYASWREADSDWGEDPDSGLATQPDHFPRIVDQNSWDVDCPTCGDPMVDGECPRCDWGEQNRAEPIEEYPLDPFRDDNAGIRAASFDRVIPEGRWTFS